MLHIFSIGSDRHLLDPSSRAFKRISEYASLVSTYTVFVFSYTKKEQIEQKNFRVVPVFGKNKFSQIIALCRVIKIECQSKSRKEIVLSSQDPFEIGLICLTLSWIFGLRLHIQVHTEFFSSFFKQESFRQRVQSIIAPFVLKKAKSIRVVSKHIKEFLVSVLRINEELVFVAPVFVARSEEMLISKKQNKIVFVGRFEKVKNFERLIASFEILASRLPELRLEIFGEGSLKTQITKRISKSAYKERIAIFPFQNNPFEVMSQASAFVISSDYEGYAMTAVESVMSGTPVCMTPVGCAYEFIQDGVNGFVSPGFSIPDFAKTLEKTLKFPFRQEELERSLHTLLTKEEYFKILVHSWNKAL